MKLTVNNQPIITFEDSSISIERNSPLFNDQTGTFSYPLAVPRRENNQALGFPGRLTRVGDINNKPFVLNDRGIDLMRGSVDFDEVNANEAGIILQSGMTEFYAKMKDKTLKDVDFGSIDLADWGTTMQLLDSYNNAETSDFVAVPFRRKSRTGENSVRVVNNVDGVDGHLATMIASTSYNYYCLQFRFSFLIRKIFEQAGYTVVKDELVKSDLNNIILFGKMFQLCLYGVNWEWRLIGCDRTTLELKDLMPDDENIVDFLAKVKSLLCICIDINERTKEVSVYFKKEIFKLENNVSSFSNRELSGWVHKEKATSEGLKIFYSNQENDEFASEYGYTIYEAVDTFGQLPTITDDYKDKIVSVLSTERDYKAINKGTEADPDWKWVRFGRLKPYVEGNGESEYELAANVPMQTTVDVTFEYENLTNEHTIAVEMPYVEIEHPVGPFLVNVPFTISVYHGKKTIGAYQVPITTSEIDYMNGLYRFATNLLPTTLYQLIYSEWVQWQTYKARKCTKYLELSMWEVVMLQWYKRYLVNSVALVLSMVSYDLPYNGIVKIEAFSS